MQYGCIDPSWNFYMLRTAFAALVFLACFSSLADEAAPAESLYKKRALEVTQYIQTTFWDAKTGHKLQTGHGTRMAMNRSPVFSWDGKRVLGHATNVTKTIVWDAVTGQHVRTLANFKYAVLAGSLNEDGTVALLATGTGNGLLWDVNTGEITKTIGISKASALCAALSSDARRGIIGVADGSAAILDLVEGKARSPHS